MSSPLSADVLIVGGGPCGLMLANELGRRGITAILVDEKVGTALNPQANATQARSMEHYRRLGFADEIRAQGLPSDHPTDVAYFTRYTKHQLARFVLPSARDATRAVRRLTGSWSTSELPHRVSQKFVEVVLRRHAESLPGISLNYGWRLSSFVDQGAGGIRAEIERVADGARRVLQGRFLMGADGPRSSVRRSLGIAYLGERGTVRDFMGGPMLAVYLRSADFYQRVPHPKAWMYTCFNRERRSFMAAVNGRDEFAFHTQLRDGETVGQISEADAREAFQSACGAPVHCEVISHMTWTAGHALVAERMSEGRVFIGGDAAHLFTPTGGLGYNTAIEDAVNLGWKLAAVVKGEAGDGLLESYDAERGPVAKRNTDFARGFADSIGLFEAEPEIEDDTPSGAAARARAGVYLEAHARAEFNIPGITFGGRYDESPIIVSDGTAAPPDGANTYVATACPGGRAPHMWLNDGQTSLFDLFGFGWTVLRMGPHAPDPAPLAAAAALAGIDLQVVGLPATVRDLYEADLALIRPDQIVAWRGNEIDPDSATRILAQATGRHTQTRELLAG